MKKLVFLVVMVMSLCFALHAQADQKTKPISRVTQTVHNTFSKHKEHNGYKVKSEKNGVKHKKKVNTTTV